MNKLWHYCGGSSLLLFHSVRHSVRVFCDLTDAKLQNKTQCNRSCGRCRLPHRINLNPNLNPWRAQLYMYEASFLPRLPANTQLPRPSCSRILRDDFFIFSYTFQSETELKHLNISNKCPRYFTTKTNLVGLTKYLVKYERIRIPVKVIKILFNGENRATVATFIICYD